MGIYPMYELAHPIEDAIEPYPFRMYIEFEVSSIVYWVLEDWEDTEKPRQINSLVKCNKNGYV